MSPRASCTGAWRWQSSPCCSSVSAWWPRSPGAPTGPPASAAGHRDPAAGVRASVQSAAPSPTALPLDLPVVQVFAAKASHGSLYPLMFAMPLIGWGMVSAGGYPVTMFKGFDLPPIAPHDATIYAALHAAHVWLALLLFAIVLVHLAAALFHAWVRRDGVFSSMASGPRADDGG